MPETTQLPLPGMPLRFIVSAVWEAADRPATIRATVDTPSDQYCSQFVGHDTQGRMTLEELADLMCTMLLTTFDRLGELGGADPR